MKKIILSLFLLPAFAVCLAQTKNDTPAKTVLTKPTQTSSSKQTLKTPGTNRIIEKLPDLRITAATVTAASTGTGVYKLTILCTVKNDGNAPISLANISFDGLLAPESYIDRPLEYTGFTPACGITGGLASESLQPGASFSKQYYCFNKAMAQSDKPVYVLLINRGSEIKEHNKENNRQNVYITFN